MTQAIFVNLPVADLAASRAFYEGVGFTINPLFSDDTAICVVISETIYVMALTLAKWADFTDLPPADPRTSSPHMLALSFASRAAVDGFVTAATAHGGGIARPAQDMGFMYSQAVTDPDGHIWEPMWMDPAAAAAGPPADA